MIAGVVRGSAASIDSTTCGRRAVVASSSLRGTDAEPYAMRAGGSSSGVRASASSFATATSLVGPMFRSPATRPTIPEPRALTTRGDQRAI
jgi:hypothetical protein